MSTTRPSRRSKVPEASSPAALGRMQRQRRRDTEPEMELRRILHRRGFRYNVDFPALPSSRTRQDLVFPSARVAVEVRGCFWHSCPEHATRPKANGSWWEDKLAANVARDADSARQLEAAGWDLVVVWEHEDPLVAAERVARIVDAHRPGRGAEAVTPSS
jgi:DNA mismatch endonuclease (patch repair protein)